MDLRAEKVKLKDKKVKALYVDSFPKEERMPFAFMVMLSKKTDTDFLAFFDKEVLCGFVYMAVTDNITFVMFLAVDKTLRANGYGSAILSKVQSVYPNHKIIIPIERFDAEAENNNERIRRKHFYTINGYTETGYFIQLSHVEQELIIRNGAFDKDEFYGFLRKYSNGAMRPRIWKD